MRERQRERVQLTARVPPRSLTYLVSTSVPDRAIKSLHIRCWWRCLPTLWLSSAALSSLTSICLPGFQHHLFWKHHDLSRHPCHSIVEKSKLREIKTLSITIAHQDPAYSPNSSNHHSKPGGDCSLHVFQINLLLSSPSPDTAESPKKQE